MATVGDLKNITSTSADNVSTITLEFNNGASMDTAMLELSAKIDSVAPSFPDGVGTPTMVKINPDMLPVVVAAVDMEGSDIIALSEYVDGTLINELEGIDGVASVSASGLIEEEITVSIEQELIDQVNSIILKEVDEELYEVEQELIDGEKQLNEAKSRLAKEGKAGLQQIDDALTQIQQGQTQMPQMIAQLQQQKQQLQQQLEQTLQDTQEKPFPNWRRPLTPWAIYPWANKSSRCWNSWRVDWPNCARRRRRPKSSWIR